LYKRQSLDVCLTVLRTLEYLGSNLSVCAQYTTQDALIYVGQSERQCQRCAFLRCTKEHGYKSPYSSYNIQETCVIHNCNVACIQYQYPLSCVEIVYGTLFVNQLGSELVARTIILQDVTRYHTHTHCAPAFTVYRVSKQHFMKRRSLGRVKHESLSISAIIHIDVNLQPYRRRESRLWLYRHILMCLALANAENVATTTISPYKLHITRREATSSIAVLVAVFMYGPSAAHMMCHAGWA
jgi:hypothetical protein